MRYARDGIALLLTLAAAGGLAACGDDGGATYGSTGTESAAPERGTAGAGKPSGENRVGYGNRPAGGGEREGVETIVVRDGKPVGGVRELEYDAGERVRFRVRSDVADEVHVHGYDLSKEVETGATVTFSFPADIEGIFEVELEERVEQIAELRVNP